MRSDLPSIAGRERRLAPFECGELPSSIGPFGTWMGDVEREGARGRRVSRGVRAGCRRGHAAGDHARRFDAVAPALRLIGGFRVSSTASRSISARSEQRLLALLGAARTATTVDPSLADRLWPDAKRDPKANLRGVVLRLDERIRAHVLVRSDTLELRQVGTSTLRIATDTARRIDAGDPPCTRWPLTDLFCADLLPDWDEWWLHGERECFRQLRLHALERLATQALSGGPTRSRGRVRARAPSTPSPCESRRSTC